MKQLYFFFFLILVGCKPTQEVVSVDNAFFVAERIEIWSYPNREIWHREGDDNMGALKELKIEGKAKAIFAKKDFRFWFADFQINNTSTTNNKFGIDFSFLYLHFDEIDNSYNHSVDPITQQPNPDFGGTYKSVVFSPGIGITYGF